MLDFDVNAFVDDWVRAWNDRDLPAVLAHFSDDAVFTSPIAARIDPGTSGVVRGKKAIQEYWAAALSQNLTLHFEITGVFTGVDCVLIRFRNEAGMDRIEMLRFRDGLVIEGHDTFAFQREGDREGRDSSC